MANETLYSSNVVVAAAVDAAIAPMFLNVSLMAGLVAAFNPGMPNTNAKKLPKSGSITASVVSEGSSATAQTLTDTSVTLTLTKAVVVTKPTEEALRFASNGANQSRHAALAAQACADKFDVDALALSAGFSQTVDSGTSLTVAKLQEALYTLRLGKMPSTRAAAVLHTKQMYQLEGDIRSGGNAIYGNPNFSLDALKGAGQAKRGFQGELFGCELYQTSNVYVDTAPTPDDNVGMVINPDYAIAALYPSGNVPSFETTVDGSVGFLESVKHIKTLMWYTVAEYVDTAGVGLKSDI